MIGFRAGALRLFAGGLAVAVTAFAAGCGSDDSSKSQTDASGQSTVKVGILPYANIAPLYIGMERGFFKDEGITVKPQVFQSGSEEVAALVSGSLQAAFIGYFTTSVPVSKGLPIKIVVNNDHEAESADKAWAALTLVKKDSDIKSVKDLAGKTVAVNALKSQAEVQNTASWKKQGLDPGSVKLLEVPFPEMGAALERGSVDAINIAEPFSSAEMAKGARLIDTPLVTVADGKGNFPNAGWATTEKLMSQDSDVVEGMTRALEKSVEYAREHPDAAKKVIPEFTSLTPEQVDKIRLPYWNAKVDRPLLETAIRLADETGVLDKPVAVDDILAPSARQFR